jgi:FKBP-type peptidyl-prolyl cis-trans isomerase
MRFDLAKISLLAALLTARGWAQDTAAAPQPPRPVKPMAEQPLQAFEELGASFAVSARIGELHWSEEQFNAFVAGLSDGYHHRHQPFDESARELYAAMAQTVQEIDRKQREEAFLDPKNVEKYMRETRRTLNMQQTDSGLCYMVQGGGGSNRPAPTDTVVISYDVTAPDLQTALPNLSASRARVKVSDLLPGLAEGVQMMTSDSKGFFLVPPSLSFGTAHWPDGVAKNSPLIYRVTLHEIDPVAAP